MWNTLEIAKLLVAALTPLAVVAVAFQVTKATKRLESSQWLNQRLVEKRIALFAEALPRLNDIYCYFTWVGRWKEMSPWDVIQYKRILDQLFYANQPFFENGTIETYKRFADKIYKTYSAPGRNAQLRTGPSSEHGNRREAFSGQWDTQWTEYFTASEYRTATHVVVAAYEDLLRNISSNIVPNDSKR